MASRCTTALVEPPIAASATIALRNEPRGQQRARPALGGDHLDGQPPGLVGPLEQAAVRRRGAASAGQRHAERFGDQAPSSTRCPWCCSGRGCGSSTTRTRGTRSSDSVPARTSSDSRQTSVPQPSGCAPERAGQHRAARDHHGRAGRPRPPPSAAPGWSCRSRRAGPRRRSGWPGASPRWPSRPCCARASRSAAPASRRARRPAGSAGCRRPRRHPA